MIDAPKTRVDFELSTPKLVHLVTLYMAGKTGSKEFMSASAREWPQMNQNKVTHMVKDVLFHFGTSAYQMELPPEAILRRQEMIAAIRGCVAVEGKDLTYMTI